MIDPDLDDLLNRSENNRRMYVNAARDEGGNADAAAAAGAEALARATGDRGFEGLKLYLAWLVDHGRLAKRHAVAQASYNKNQNWLWWCDGGVTMHESCNTIVGGSLWSLPINGSSSPQIPHSALHWQIIQTGAQVSQADLEKFWPRPRWI
jgi:hypothetical protein